MYAKESKLMFSKVNNTKSIWRMKIFRKKKGRKRQKRVLYKTRFYSNNLSFIYLVRFILLCFFYFDFPLGFIILFVKRYTRRRQQHTHAKICLIQNIKVPGKIALFPCSLFFWLLLSTIKCFC